MYAMVKVEDTIRILPERFGEDLDEVVREIVQKSFEGTMRKDHGIIIAANSIEPVGDGIIIHGDGAMYQKVAFDALMFKPELQEVVDGIICEIVEFGAFCHIGPIDALIHMSQIMNDYVEVDAENEIITGKEKKMTLKTGDPIRARIVAVSMNELSARESKIGLTMRQPALGAHEWLKEPKKEEEGKEEEKDKKEKEKEGTEVKNLNACKNCHILTEKNICPNCSVPTSKRWRGYLIIRDPSTSQIAEKMNITKPGKYALKVR